MRTNILNQAEIDAINAAETPGILADMLNFTFAFETREYLAADISINYRGQILESVLDTIEQYFDDFDDWDFTYSYETYDTTDTEVIWRGTIKVTHIVN